ncbi:MAG TPA: murein biosynthesis integral membrane protein MurJ, partial [Gemmatimonadaceae bacterium]
LGVGDAADAWMAAFRIPNLLQNLFGEGVLSASFIPVYARLLARGERDEARRVANAVAGILALATSLLVVAGIAATPLLIDLVAPGFEGAKRELTVRLVRILFPGAGLLVFSAWCLGVLNSHRRFLLSYIAPVVWNAAIVAALLVTGGAAGESALVVAAAWGSVAGSLLQVAVQLPTVVRLAGRIRPTLARDADGVRQTLRNFGPVFVGRGVVQISAYVDMMLASLVGTGAAAILGFAQTLYVLPVSLFGMAVSAAELPAMASALGTEEEVAATLRARLAAGAARIAFLIVPSAAAFLAFGDLLAGALFESGAFDRRASLWVWATLAGYAIGLLATTHGRLYSSGFYALHDTRTPLRFAVVRVALSAALGWAAALTLPDALGVDPLWGVAGLAAASGIAGWVELALLRHALRRRIGVLPRGRALLPRLGLAAGAGAAAAWGVRLLLDGEAPLRVEAVLVASTFGLTYFAVCWALGVSAMRDVVAALRRRTGRGSAAGG